MSNSLITFFTLSTNFILKKIFRSNKVFRSGGIWRVFDFIILRFPFCGKIILKLLHHFMIIFLFNLLNTNTRFSFYGKSLKDNKDILDRIFVINKES